jgi:hypothetical protein
LSLFFLSFLLKFIFFVFPTPFPIRTKQKKTGRQQNQNQNRFGGEEQQKNSGRKKNFFFYRSIFSSVREKERGENEEGKKRRCVCFGISTITIGDRE